MSVEEFAEFVGSDEFSDLEMALEEAYAAGIEDAIRDSAGVDFAEGEEIPRAKTLRTGTRRNARQHAPEKGPVHKRARSKHNGAESVRKH